MLVIWGRITSVNVQKAVFAAGASNVPFERKEAGGTFGIVDTPAYRAMNPNGLVPVLVDGDLVMWESNAIVRYITARYGGALWPAEPVTRAQADRWADWQQTTLNGALGPAFLGLVRTAPEKRDHAAIEASIARTEAATTILDAHLAGSPFLGGGTMTFADLILGPPIHRWLNMPVSRQPRPHLQRWYETLRSHPAADAAMPLPVA